MDTRQKFSFEEERLTHFVNREEQLKRAREIITGPAGESLPVIVFYGSWGMGKTSLLHKIRLDCCSATKYADEEAEASRRIPYALVDFAAGGQGMRSRAGMLGFITRELAREAYGIPFPRYELVNAKLWEIRTQSAFEPQKADAGEFGTLMAAVAALVGGVGGPCQAARRQGRAMVHGVARRFAESRGPGGVDTLV